MGQVIPSSYSAITSFETCPRKHYLTRVAKVVPDPPGEAALWGTAVHEALERYLKDPDTELPKRYACYQPLADKLLSKCGEDAELLVEAKLAVTEDLEGCGFWDSRAWFRGVVDVAIVRGDQGWIFDWKTGKPKTDSDQLELFSALLFANNSGLQQVTTSFIWLQNKTLTTKQYGRKDAGVSWANLIPRITRLQQAESHNKWPPRPAGLCRKWCPVGFSLCEHCGKG